MSMAQKLRRISVAVDEKINNMLRNLANKKNKTVSEIIRKAISIYSEIENGNKVLPEKTVKYAELLSSKEHVIVDIELWIAMLDELAEKASDNFWKLIEEIGFEHGVQYKARGITEVEEVLKLMESSNWFRINESGKIYTLILFSRNEQKILKIFLENMFRALDIPVKIIEGFRKLILIT